MVTLGCLASQMKLEIRGSGDPEISGITDDSRNVAPGWIFAAQPGVRFNGRNFAAEAVARGAAAVLLPEPDLELAVPRLLAPKERLHSIIAFAASIIYGHPTDQLITVGLTGTNGKTTVSYLMEAILKRAGLKPGVMGTVNYRWPGETRPAPNTTPEGSVLFGVLVAMYQAGCRSAILEVSSHGLSLGRVAGLNFEVALFTNLSRDHLDFHKDMDDYYKTKKLLFTRYLRPGVGRAVINIDDKYGRRLAGELGERALTYGFSEEAQVRGDDLRVDRNGLSLSISVPGGKTWHQTSPLLGEVNACNILAAAAMALSLRLALETIREALALCPGAPGRLEKVGSNSDYLVLVDYAHTPDALAKVLKTAGNLEAKRLFAVFGCGGDRDRGKRPLMGRLGGEIADLCLLTSDNPRTEEPWGILLEIEEGLKTLNLNRYEPGELVGDGWPGGGGYLMIIDRQAAITEAVRLMTPGDVLLIAGKGHEDYQIIGWGKKPFNDQQEALAALRKMGKD
ncbi:MAG: hypothetical protein AMR96_07050 [Candidatus Adiutrix intracellularis]|nr:MAG: hypothetical protein AMR96_07050 [Candidatus Adiutrix intracellularis]